MDCPKCKISLEEKIEKVIDPSTSKLICTFPIMYSRPETKPVVRYSCKSCGYNSLDPLANR